jgi:hypothetical protein
MPKFPSLIGPLYYRVNACDYSEIALLSIKM